MSIEIYLGNSEEDKKMLDFLVEASNELSERKSKKERPTVINLKESKEKTPYLSGGQFRLFGYKTIVKYLSETLKIKEEYD